MRTNPVAFVPLVRLVPVAIAAGFIACASSSPPRELSDAHAAFARVSAGRAAETAAPDVREAKRLLLLADKAFDERGDSEATRDLAYAAKRKADLAAVHAQIFAESMQQEKANAELRGLDDQQVRITSAELSIAGQDLGLLQQLAVARAEQAQADAERRARQVAADLAGITSVSVEEEERGMVVTLPSAGLFAPGKPDLLPQGEAKLSAVAYALSKGDEDSRIAVEGYTDSPGSVGSNHDLSERRAEAVRGYLVSHGIAADRITAQGVGPAEPVGDHASPQGRAENRRVEIVVLRAVLPGSADRK